MGKSSQYNSADFWAGEKVQFDHWVFNPITLQKEALNSLITFSIDFDAYIVLKAHICLKVLVL